MIQYPFRASFMAAENHDRLSIRFLRLPMRRYLFQNVFRIRCKKRNTSVERELLGYGLLQEMQSVRHVLHSYRSMQVHKYIGSANLKVLAK